MTFKQFLAAGLGLTITATTALAEPYCAPMLDADALDRPYQRLAPIYNSTETGWIFGSDQLDYRYVLNATEQALLAELVAELAERGTQLAVLIPPPRPVVAGQAVVDATTGQPGAYDMAAQATAFHEMMTQIASTGATAPDLLTLALSDRSLTDSYYFQRDTHWTNRGAAHSALALAGAVNAQDATFDPAELVPVEMAEERGSLSRIVTATCDTTPDAETSPLFDYSSHLPQSGGLLSETGADGVQAVLLGTSFSDRYGRDQYQSADALTSALGRPVENRSVSGGGIIGPFENYLLSDDFARDRPDLIIWEFPYTYQLRETGLRQLLGALRSERGVTSAGVFELTEDEAQIDMSSAHSRSSLLGLRMVEGSARDIILRLHLEDGQDVRLRLRRKSRMEEVAILDTWWIDLRGLGAPLASLGIEVRGDADLGKVELITDAVAG
ncbi:MAG: hypothetical protein AAGA15_01325 [Pseudomonadota bacterium]